MSPRLAAYSPLSDSTSSKLIRLIQWQMPRAPGLDPLMDDLFLTHQKPISFLWLKSHYSGRRKKDGQEVLNRPRETGHFLFPHWTTLPLIFLPGCGGASLLSSCVYFGLSYRRTLPESFGKCKNLKRSWKCLSFLSLASSCNFLPPQSVLLGTLQG